MDWRKQAERLEVALAAALRHAAVVPATTRARTVLEEFQRERARELRQQAATRQQGLFGPGPETVPSRPYVRQDTSVEAAAALSRSKAETLRAQVLAAIRQQPGTDEQIARRCKMEGNTLRPRRVELVAAGLVRDSGNRRQTQRKRQAIVWEAT